MGRDEDFHIVLDGAAVGEVHGHRATAGWDSERYRVRGRTQLLGFDQRLLHGIGPWIQRALVFPRTTGDGQLRTGFDREQTVGQAHVTTIEGAVLIRIVEDPPSQYAARFRQGSNDHIVERTGAIADLHVLGVPKLHGVVPWRQVGDRVWAGCLPG